MDVISHGLWAGAAASGAGKVKTRSQFSEAFLWGMLPDLFAFGVPTMIFAFRFLSGQSATFIPMHDQFGGSSSDVMNMAHSLYSFSHSLFVVAAAFLLIILFRRIILRIKWKRAFPSLMIGWPLHILMDIPTHSLEYFPTPFLWPFSDYRFDGISWANIYFLSLNLCVLAAVYLLLYYAKEKKVLGLT